MTEQKLRTGIKVTEMGRGEWSIGICLSHYFDETYIYINLAKWSIVIGKFWH